MLTNHHRTHAFSTFNVYCSKRSESALMFVFLLLLLSEMTMTTAQNMDRIRRLKVTDNTDAHLLAFLSLRKCSPNCVVQVQRAMFNVYNGIRRKRR